MKAHCRFQRTGNPGHSTGDLLDVIFPPINSALKTVFQGYTGFPSDQLIQLSHIRDYQRGFILSSRNGTEID